MTEGVTCPCGKIAADTRWTEDGYIGLCRDHLLNLEEANTKTVMSFQEFWGILCGRITTWSLMNHLHGDTEKETTP